MWAPTVYAIQELFEVNDRTETEKPLRPLFFFFFFLIGHSRKLAPSGIIGTTSCHSFFPMRELFMTRIRQVRIPWSG